MGDIGENEPKRWKSQLPVVLSFFHFDSFADLLNLAAAILCADYIAHGLHGGGDVRSGVPSASLCALEFVLQPVIAATCFLSCCMLYIVYVAGNGK